MLAWINLCSALFTGKLLGYWKQTMWTIGVTCILITCTLLSKSLTHSQSIHTSHTLHSSAVSTEAPSGTTRSLHSSTVSTEAPSHTTRSLHSSAVSTEAPLGTTRSLHSSAVSTKVPSGTTSSLSTSGVSTEAPSHSTSSLNTSGVPTESPSNTTRSLHSSGVPTKAPLGTTRSLHSSEVSTKAPSQTTSSLNTSEFFTGASSTTEVIATSTASADVEQETLANTHATVCLLVYPIIDAIYTEIIICQFEPPMRDLFVSCNLLTGYRGIVIQLTPDRCNPEAIQEDIDNRVVKKESLLQAPLLYNGKIYCSFQNPQGLWEFKRCRDEFTNSTKSLKGLSGEYTSREEVAFGIFFPIDLIICSFSILCCSLVINVLKTKRFLKRSVNCYLLVLFISKIIRSFIIILLVLDKKLNYINQSFCFIFVYSKSVIECYTLLLIMATSTEWLIAVAFPLKRKRLCTMSRSKKVSISKNDFLLIIQL